jgi:hypothetical protein
MRPGCWLGRTRREASTAGMAAESPGPLPAVAVGSGAGGQGEDPEGSRRANVASPACAGECVIAS